MTQQERIQENVKLALGELTLQLIMARARVEELEGEAAARAKANGQDKSRDFEERSQKEERTQP
jgi:hypothetical protein